MFFLGVFTRHNRTPSPTVIRVTTHPGAVGTPLRRVAAACLVGSAIEFYDFLIYGIAAALVFPSVFFPHLTPTMATVASMGTFATAFLSRPLGAAVFGHVGDRLGRKKTLVVTLLIMAVSTVGVGMVPTPASIGAAAPLILIALRVLQGFAVGGEWAGSALLSAEYAPAGRRGWYGMFTPLGGGVALVLTSLVFLGVNATIGERSAAFLEWGWRIPFLSSVALIAVALYVRLNIDETPVFAGENPHSVVYEAPIKEVLRREHRTIVLAGGSVVSGFAFVYMASTYLARYAQSALGHSRTLILVVGVLGGLATIALVAVSAGLSDRVGRRRMMLVGRAASLPWSLAVIPLMDTGSPVLFAVAIVGMYAVGAIAAGPTASFVPELFATRYRYTGTALSSNLAGILGGALPPLIAGTLLADFGSWSLSLLLAALVSLSLVSTYLLPETDGAAFGAAPSPDLQSEGCRCCG